MPPAAESRLRTGPSEPLRAIRRLCTRWFVPSEPSQSTVAVLLGASTTAGVLKKPSPSVNVVPPGVPLGATLRATAAKDIPLNRIQATIAWPLGETATCASCPRGRSRARGRWSGRRRRSAGAEPSPPASSRRRRRRPSASRPRRARCSRRAGCGGGPGFPRAAAVAPARCLSRAGVQRPGGRCRPVRRDGDDGLERIRRPGGQVPSGRPARGGAPDQTEEGNRDHGDDAEGSSRPHASRVQGSTLEHLIVLDYSEAVPHIALPKESPGSAAGSSSGPRPPGRCASSPRCCCAAPTRSAAASAS